MEIREKIGQKLVFGFHGPEITDEFREMVRRYKIGNVILFKHNIVSVPQLQALCRELQGLIQAETGHPALITIDQEGGMVSRLPGDAVVVPGSMALAATGDPRRAYQAARITARQLRGVGVNFNLAPVLDVNSNPANPVIGVRSFGDDPQLVAAFGAQAVQGYRDGGVLCCGKHFPGHGDTAVDSHLGLPCIDKPLQALRETELVPFRAAIDAGLPAVMSSHILFPQIEPDHVPATMSRRIMHDLLRDELGFTGLILSDCMVMNAIQVYYGAANGVIAAMKAGVDLVFVSSDAALQQESAAAALKAAEEGAFDPAELDESVARILEAKRLCAFTEPTPGLAGQREDYDTVETVARQAITLVSGEPARADAQTFFCGCPDYRATQVANADPAATAFPLYMARAFGGVGAVCGSDPDEAEIARLVAQSAPCEQIVAATCNAHLYPGQAHLMAALAATGKPMTVVSLRTPYDLPLLPEGVARIAAWDYTPAILAALEEILRGGACYGELPITLPGGDAPC